MVLRRVPFAKLIFHLSNYGTTWGNKPMSIEAAESFVKAGWTPSAIISGGVLFEGADVFEKGGPLHGR